MHSHHHREIKCSRPTASTCIGEHPPACHAFSRCVRQHVRVFVCGGAVGLSPTNILVDDFNARACKTDIKMKRLYNMHLFNMRERGQPEPTQPEAVIPNDGAAVVLDRTRECGAVVKVERDLTSVWSIIAYVCSGASSAVQCSAVQCVRCSVCRVCSVHQLPMMVDSMMPSVCAGVCVCVWVGRGGSCHAPATVAKFPGKNLPVLLTSAGFTIPSTRRCWREDFRVMSGCRRKICVPQAPNWRRGKRRRMEDRIKRPNRNPG